MKSNIHKVNYDGSSNINGHWWVWKEKCDKCDKLIQDETVLHSYLEESEVDFCSECLRYLMDNHIPYTQAKMQYRKENSNDD